ncbi:MAG: hypothetical protein ABIR87_00125 [Sphingomicrobium sp.]
MHSVYLETERSDRAKAAAAVLLIHLVLGAALLTGLAIHIDQRRDTSLATFDIQPPPPPPPTDRKLAPSAKSTPAPAGQKASPSPIVAPPAKLPVEQTVAAASIAGLGAASSAGAAASGSGTGAGGAGNGLGAGAGMVGALLLNGALTRGDYQQIADLGSSRGNAELLLLVNKFGRVERCRALASSGNAQVDAALCQLLTQRARFAPAHSADGTLYYQDVHYFPRWSR